uniref:Uncharacterized protein n=1 Tax=Proboscia inermis TaxID=420281 RepID=A0A7S0C278_9STRA
MSNLFGHATTPKTQTNTQHSKPLKKETKNLAERDDKPPIIIVFFFPKPKPSRKFVKHTLFESHLNAVPDKMWNKSQPFFLLATAFPDMGERKKRHRSLLENSI